jgi:uncharacterized membrane protein YdjX (TVP38/TMEM64 family)
VNRVCRGIAVSPPRLLLAGVLCGLAVFGVLAGGLSPGGIAVLVQKTTDFLRSAGIAGAATFAALQIVVALSGALPASLLAIAAGGIYGVGVGFTLAATGNLLGAVIAFGLSRSLFRPAVAGLVARHASLNGFDTSISQHGWSLVCLLRLSPVMPFSITSYLLGLSSVRFGEYLAGTVASFPALLMYVFLGTLADAGVSAWAGGSNPVRWILYGVAGAATLLLMVQTSRLVVRHRFARPSA